jgi:dolichol-phosphate mannosyltransferase
LTQRIFAALPECDLLFIDDNSPDGTAEWVREQMEADSRIHLVIRKDERGLGGATRRALQYAVDQQYQFILNLDGDLSHDPSVLPTMLAIAKAQPEVDVVVGSRYVTDGSIDGWPMRRRVMSRMVNQFATTILRLPVTDCSGSMRCYRVAALKKLDPRTLKSESYAILEETLVRLSKNGSKMVEIPIHFIDRVRGSSKLTSREAMKSAIQLFRVAIRT